MCKKLEKSGRDFEKNNKVVFVEQGADFGDPSWLYSSEKFKESTPAVSNQDNLIKEGKFNRVLCEKQRTK